MVMTQHYVLKALNMTELMTKTAKPENSITPKQLLFTREIYSTYNTKLAGGLTSKYSFKGL